MRFPVVTVGVFVGTAVVNALQFVVPGMLSHLERTSAAGHGEWWRLGTSLFVQDGGVGGTLSNLFFLAVVGFCAEQVVSRGLWLAGYFGVGLVSEFVGLAWQPTGGGNSIAVCGLAGLVALALWREDKRLPKFAPHVTLMWCGALLATWNLWLVVVCVMGPGAIAAATARNLPAGRMVAAFSALTGLFLAVVANIHGAALLLGLALALSLQTAVNTRSRDEVQSGSAF